MHDRRFVLKGAAAIALAASLGVEVKAMEESHYYGLIGQMLAQPGRRTDLIDILMAGTGSMPGNLAYIIAEDRENPDAIWISEVWETEESHAASLQLPAVQEAIAQARPLLAGFGYRFETTPVGGIPVGSPEACVG